MKIFLQISAVFLMFVILARCSGPDQSNQSNIDKIRLESNETDSSLALSDFEVIYAPNAPTRISRNIKQDKEGNLLIASYEGIIQYDGHSFSNLTKEKGLEECSAFDVLEDKMGNIWIASDQAGAFRIDAATGDITNFTTKDGLANRRNMCIYEDKAGNIWIGGSGGISRYDGKSFVNFTTEEGLTHNNINTIIEDRTGKIWYGTRVSAGVYDGKTFTEIKNDKGLPFHNVWSITEDRKGNIWLADTVGLWRYDGASFTNVSAEIRGIYEDSEGDFWSTDLPRFFPAVFSHIDAKSLFSKKVKVVEIFKTEGVFLGISDDKKGNIWIGGGDGVWCYDGKTMTYYTGKQKKN